MVFTTDRFKAAEAHEWNAAHAEIEVKAIKNMGEVAAYFQNHPEVAQLKALQAHYEAVAKSVIA